MQMPNKEECSTVSSKTSSTTTESPSERYVNWRQLLLHSQFAATAALSCVLNERALVRMRRTNERRSVFSNKEMTKTISLGLFHTFIIFDSTSVI